MDIQRAAELLAARSTKDFGNALKDRGDPFKDFYKSLPICILDAVFSIGVRYTSVVNVVNSYMATFDLTISRTQTDETEHTIRDFLTNVAKYDTVEDFSKNVLHNMQRTSSRNGIFWRKRAGRSRWSARSTASISRSASMCGTPPWART